MDTREKLANFYFSQSALNVFQQCSLKFKRKYIDNLYWSRKELLNPEQRQAMEEGVLFHLLAQRYFSGLPTGIEDYPPLQVWLNRLIGFLPWQREKNFWPEYQLRLNKQGLKLTAKYDLISLEPEGKVVIYDWKTEKRKLEGEKLALSWQTILYRFLLVEAGEAFLGQPLIPESIKMVYWSPLYPQHVVELAYSEELYQQDQRALEGLIQEIISREEKEFCPTSQGKNCSSCEYSYLCQKGRIDYNYLLGETDLEEQFVWEAIEEYPY